MHELHSFFSFRPTQTRDTGKKKRAHPKARPPELGAQLSSSALSLTVDDGVVSSKCRVEESLKGAGFLNGHGELRSRGGVKTLTRVGSDRDDIATRLLARAVALYSEGEATGLILLAKITHA